MERCLSGTFLARTDRIRLVQWGILTEPVRHGNQLILMVLTESNLFKGQKVGKSNGEPVRNQSFADRTGQIRLV